jgi:hypothetical protein
VQKSLNLNYLINISPKKPNSQPKQMNSIHAKLTRKPLDQIGTRADAQCALCKFFLVAKLFHRLNTCTFPNDWLEISQLSSFSRTSHRVNFHNTNIVTLSRNRCLFTQMLTTNFVTKVYHKILLYIKESRSSGL